MIKLSMLKIDFLSTLEGNNFVVEEPRIYQGYHEGVKTGPAGMAYTILCEGLGYEKQVVKIEGEMEPSIKYDGKPVKVKFEELEGKAYQDFEHKGELKLSISAKGIIPVESNRLKVNKGGID